MRIAAIDQGTTSTRVLVFEEDGTFRIAHSVRHRQFYPRPGWVEHDPLELLANVKACVAAAGPVDAIAIANQGESCLAWDAVDGQPLSPVIVWQDDRTADAVERLKAQGLDGEVASLSGLPLDCYFSASKLAWIIEHEDRARAARASGRLRLGTTDSFLLDRLAGIHATDATTASRTSLMNIRTLDWDDRLCTLFGVPREALAPIRASADDFGTIGGVPVKASMADQQAALFGHGCREAGEAKITFGTGAFALALTGGEPAAATGGLITTVAWRAGGATRYAIEGGVYDVGAAIEWAMRIGILASPDELAAFSAPSAASRGIAFVPALSGLACPQWDRQAGGLWIGMTTGTTRQDLLQALIEGVALQTRQIVSALDGAADLGPHLSVDGGVASSPYFLQYLADVTGKVVLRRGNPELTAYGCALMAGLRAPTGAARGDVEYRPRGGVSIDLAVYAQALGRSLAWHR